LVGTSCRRSETVPAKVAIIGRPNVGKSALFNRICGKRKAIVDEAVGITRDRLYAQADFFGRPFTVIDTGGLDSRSTAPFNPEIKSQTELAIREADALIFVVDGEVGITDLDAEVASLLLRIQKPVCLAVNKVDDAAQEWRLHAFHSLAIQPIFGISALHARGLTEMLGYLLSRLPHDPSPDLCAEDIRVALIGRPNVGKSTLLNFYVGEQRSIVSPHAGTTRDTVDAQIAHGDFRLRILDTAGIRQRKSQAEVVDKFAAIRTEEAIRAADVCVLLGDSRDGLTAFEKRIATTIEEAGKGCVLAFNKWDLVKQCRMEHAAKKVREESAFLNHCPLLFISATTGRNLEPLLNTICDVAQGGRQTISTGRLNRFLEEAMQRLHPPVILQRRLRIYYMTQVGHAPPRFLLFVNDPRLMADSYHRYLVNQFRLVFGCSGNPVLFSLKGKPR
jgi:GTPase